MGRVGHVSGDAHRKTRGSGVRSTRVSKKDTADKQTRHRAGAHKAGKAVAAQDVVDEPLVLETSQSVWEDLGFSVGEAANLRARSELMIQIREIIRNNGWTQAAAARHCSVSQPRMNDLLRGKIDKFSLDALFNMTASLGLKVHLELKVA